MSHQDATFLRQIEIAVGRLALRYGISSAFFVITITAAAAIWANHIDTQLSQVMASQAQEQADTKARTEQWAEWRRSVDLRLASMPSGLNFQP